MLMITGTGSWGAKSTPLPATITKVAFSIIFFQMPMYKTAQSSGEPPALTLSLLFQLAFGSWERQDAKLILGEVAPGPSLTGDTHYAPGFPVPGFPPLCSWQSGS